MNRYLDLIVAILVTCLFGGLGLYAFYHTFRSYKNRDFFSMLPGDLIVFSIVPELIMWISKKFGSEKSSLIIYRVLIFCFGLLMLAFVILYWFLAMQAYTSLRT